MSTAACPRSHPRAQVSLHRAQHAGHRIRSAGGCIRHARQRWRLHAGRHSAGPGGPAGHTAAGAGDRDWPRLVRPQRHAPRQRRRPAAPLPCAAAWRAAAVLPDTSPPTGTAAAQPPPPGSRLPPPAAPPGAPQRLGSWHSRTPTAWRAWRSSVWDTRVSRSSTPRARHRAARRALACAPPHACSAAHSARSRCAPPDVHSLLPAPTACGAPAGGMEQRKRWWCAGLQSKQRRAAQHKPLQAPTQRSAGAATACTLRSPTPVSLSTRQPPSGASPSAFAHARFPLPSPPPPSGTCS